MNTFMRAIIAVVVMQSYSCYCMQDDTEELCLKNEFRRETFPVNSSETAYLAFANNTASLCLTHANPADPEHQGFLKTLDESVLKNIKKVNDESPAETYTADLPNIGEFICFKTNNGTWAGNISCAIYTKNKNGRLVIIPVGNHWFQILKDIADRK